MKELIIIVIIIGAIIFWKWLAKAAKKDALKKLKDFDIDEKYIADDNKGAIALDYKKEKVCILNHQSKPHYYTYGDITKVELNQPIEGKVKGSKTGALIGGAIAGKKGATVGYVSGSRNVVTVKGVQLIIYLDNLKTPNHIITFLKTPVRSSSIIYINAHKTATFWKEKLDVFVESSKRKKSKQKIESGFSIGDELKKLNDLKKQGVLTEEEFQSQKTKLLS